MSTITEESGWESLRTIKWWGMIMGSKANEEATWGKSNINAAEEKIKSSFKK